MSAPVMLLDLDETLVMTAQAEVPAFLATCERARTRHGVASEELHRAVLVRARDREIATLTELI